MSCSRHSCLKMAVIGVLVSAGCLLFSVKGHASRARVQALQSNHLKDTELSFLFPTKLLEIPNYILIQSGSTLGATVESRPYLLAKKTMNEQASDRYAVGVALGRPSDLIDRSREYMNIATTSAFKLSSNSLNINYAARSLGYSYAIDLFYAAENDKVNKVSNHGNHLNLGFRFNDLSFFAGSGFLNEVDDFVTSSRLSVSQAFVAGVLFEFDDIYLMFDLNSSRAKKKVLGTEVNDLEILDYKMSFVKNFFAGVDTIFYRVNFETSQNKNRLTGGSTVLVQLPMVIGFESPMTDAMILRSSIKQIVGMFHQNDQGPGLNTTTAAVGLGLKYNSLSVDGVFEGLIGSNANQNLDGNSFLAGTSLTYWF